MVVITGDGAPLPLDAGPPGATSTAADALAAAGALHERCRGLLVSVRRLCSYLDCPDHPGAGLSADVCEHLACYGDPNDVHRIHSFSPMLVRVGPEPDTWWEGGALHAAWPVQLVTCTGLQHENGLAIHRSHLVQPWITPEPITTRP